MSTFKRINFAAAGLLYLVFIPLDAIALLEAGRPMVAVTLVCAYLITALWAFLRAAGWQWTKP